MPMKLIQEIILPIQHVRIQRAPPADDRAPNPAGRSGGVVVVHAHTVDAQLGQVRGRFCGILLRGKIAAEAQVHPPDFQAFRPGVEVTVLNTHKAVGSRGLGRKPRKIGS